MEREQELPPPAEGDTLAGLESWLRSPVRRTLLLVVAASIATAGTSIGAVELRRAWGGGPEEQDLLLRQGVIWLAWAAAFMPLYGLAGAIARRAPGWPVAFACHLPIAAAVASLFLLLENALTTWVQGPERTAFFRERVLAMEDPTSTVRRPPWERDVEPPGPDGSELPGDASPGTGPQRADAPPPRGSQRSPREGARRENAAAEDAAEKDTSSEDGSGADAASQGRRRGRERQEVRRRMDRWRRSKFSPGSGFVTGDVLLDFERRWSLRVPRYALIYFALVGLGLGARAFLTGRSREREAAALELRASRLQAALTTAQLGALKSQLHPHFLFNALHSVGGMIRVDRGEDALRALASIGDLLRTSLDAGPEQFVSLAREVELARRFLGVEQMRLGDRLAVEVDVPAPLEAAEVPALITQPLVENAVQHGVAAGTGSGTILLRAAADPTGTRLLIDVEDDGPGFEPGEGGGVGLRHVRSRLAALFEQGASLEVHAMEGGGTRARLSLPLDDLDADGAAEVIRPTGSGDDRDAEGGTQEGTQR